MKAWIALFCLIGLSAAAAEEPSLKDFQRKPYVISNEEVQQIKDEIRTKCHLPQAQEMTYPWYYHYEVGLAMQKKQDWQRALDSLLVALEQRDHPQKFTRIYGMWFIDYYPYYNIGMAHYYLQNWKCAVQSFRLSQMFEDIPSSSVRFYRLREFSSEAQQKLQNQ
jgi:hypothetical protein